MDIELLRELFNPMFLFFPAVILMFGGRELWLCATNQCAINDMCVTGCGKKRAPGSTVCRVHRQDHNRGVAQ